MPIQTLRASESANAAAVEAADGSGKLRAITLRQPETGAAEMPSAFSGADMRSLVFVKIPVSSL
eukprot:5724788-Pyramimonas_sp.AAC.1